MTPEFVTALVAIIGMIVAFLGGYILGWDDYITEYYDSRDEAYYMKKHFGVEE